MKRLFLAALTAATAAIAFGAAAQPLGEGCLRSQWLRNHTVGDQNTLYFDYNGKDTYKLTMTNGCLAGVVSSDPIVLSSHSQSLMCKPIDWDITARGIRCIVGSVTKMTPAEVAALPKGKRP
jgi:hypothetical protein